MVYVKHVVTDVKMSTWTRVYYNNTISLSFNAPLIFVAQLSVQPAVAHSPIGPLVDSIAMPAVSPPPSSPGATTRTAVAAAADAQSPLASVSVLTPLPPLQVQGLTAPWSSLISLVMLSALGGLGISYAGFGFRSLVSATTFTLAGSAALLSLLPSHFLDSFSPFFARFHRLDERFQRAERGPRTGLSCRPLCPG